MGTSSDYTGGTGGAWTPYKHASTNFLKRGGEPRADRVLARYVAALGGAVAAATSGTGAFVGPAQGLADLGVGLATQGLTPTLEDLGLSHLVGADRYDVLDALLERLAGDGSTLEEQAVLSALCEAFEELFPEDAESYGQLEQLSLDVDGLVALIEGFVVRWVYDRMLPTLGERLAHIEDPEVVRKRDSELRERLGLLVKLQLEDRDPLTVDWSGAEGAEILGKLVVELYEDMEELES
jgi:hypothetical protein